MQWSLARSDGYGGWPTVGRQVLALRPREELKVWKYEVGDPARHGFTLSFGSLRGQIADYRLTLKDCRCIHILEFEDHYLVHWDEVSPTCDLIEHARRDAPGVYVGASTLVSAAVGAMASPKGHRVEGAIVGSLVGLLFGLLTAA